MNGNPNTLYFNDGIDGEMHGLFGAMTVVPEPSTLALLGAGGCSTLRHRLSHPVDVSAWTTNSSVTPNRLLTLAHLHPMTEGVRKAAKALLDVLG